MQGPRSIAGWVGFVLLAGCGSSQPSALGQFEGTPCKLDHDATGMTFRAAAADYEGMQCVVWEPAGENMHIDLFNFRGGCSIPWEGDATVSPGAASLRLVNPQDGGALCGSCLYDWAFEVVGMDQSGDVVLTVHVDYEPGDDDDSGEQFTLPLDDMPSGAFCRYADGWLMQDYASGTESCGQEMMPCREPGPEGYCLCGTCMDPPDPCEAGLQCEAGTEGNVCHLPCTADGECGPGRTCQSGLCRPANPW